MARRITPCQMLGAAGAIGLAAAALLWALRGVAFEALEVVAGGAGLALLTCALFLAAWSRGARSPLTATLLSDGERRLLALLRDIPVRVHVLRGPDLAAGGTPAAASPGVPTDLPAQDQGTIDGPGLGGPGRIEQMQHVYRTGERVEVRDALVRLDRHGDGAFEETYWTSVYQALRDDDRTIRGVLAFDIEVTRDVLQRRRLEHGNALTAALARALSPEDVAREGIERGAAAFGATCGAVWILWPDASELVLEHAVGYSEAALRRFHHIALDAPLPVAEATRGGRAVWIESRAGYVARFPDATGAWAPMREHGELSLLCVPLRVEGRSIGCLSFHFDRRRAFSAEEREAVEAVAEQCSQALHRAMLFREVQAASRLKDEFLSTISHELRTPLNAILGWAAILRRSQGDLSKGLEVIERNARHQAQLVEDILDVSRLVTGSLRIEAKPVALSQVLRAALAVVAPAAAAKGIEVHADVEDAVGVEGDADRLRQVFWNLLSNAVKFTPREGRIDVTMEGSGLDVVVRVQDTGCGIDRAFLPYMFQRFRQADASPTRAVGGLGLGLAIVRHLVELHGGTVSVESEGRNRGAAFCVRLPLQPRPYERPRSGSLRAAAAPLSTLGAGSSSRRLDGVSLVVCDDDADTRELLQEILRAEGARTFIAGSAAEALALLREWRPDALVSDIGLPQVDGYALVREVRALSAADGGRIPAIALTAHADFDDAGLAIAAGFQVHLPKPIEPSSLVAALLRVLPPAAHGI